MAPGVSYTQTNLGYPAFAAEFDPYSRGYLIVGGGGSENRAGVPNKITALDVSSHKAISIAAEIELSRDEDSPQSIGSLATKDGLITFAGINSSSASQKSGKNEHFRAFEVVFPKERQGEKKDIRFLGQSALFDHARGSANKSYQRLLRLSRVQRRDTANKRIGAIATGMADSNEVIIFDATTQTPNKESVCAQLKLQKEDEAADIDIWEPEPSQFYCAWCTDHEVYLYSLEYNFTTKTSKPKSFEPALIYSQPQGSGLRPKLKGLRWLGPRHLLVLQNQPQNQGAELFIVRLHKPGEPGQVTLRKSLPSKVKSTIGLDVTHLDPDPATGERQIVIAVHSKDGTIPMFMLSYDPSNSDSQLSRFSDYHVIPAMHPTDITKVCLSSYFAPRQPATSIESVASKTQYIQLASVALGGTVVVCSIPLTSVPTSPSKTTEVDDNNRNSPNVRWVLSDSKTEGFTSLAGRVALAIFVMLFAIALSRYLSMTAESGESLTSILNSMRRPPGERLLTDKVKSPIVSVAEQATVSLADAHASVTSAVDEAASMAASISASASHAITSHGILDLVKHHWRAQRTHASAISSFKSASVAERMGAGSDGSVQAPEPPKALHMVLDPETGKISASHHHDDDVETLQAKGAKKFEELSHHEQQNWRQRLLDAGHWAEDLPMTVLKGVFFSEYAGVVGGALRDAVIG